MNIDLAQAKAIFLRAAEQTSAASRQELLAKTCGDNVELRQHVEMLLAAHEQAGSFLENGAFAREATRAAERPGAQIGAYKLLEQIGEGGMGTVFMAEQTQPVQRKVALKVIKAGMDSGQVVARFEAERQALALMDHPNIAKVLDAGTTDAGRPYFVMELVKGVPITQYCDENHLLPKARLDLFAQVCQAVQHAHQKGIIHRDIKPTNVLITLYDDRPVPKVIDFGVAKATGAKLTERTMCTGYGQIVGTLEYMSPEQARLNALDVDTRGDIYSLGVLLYELLTGTTPFEKKRLHEAAFDEILRMIREDEPPKPSTRLSTAEGLASIAANRSMEPGKLSVLVRGELDWIVMKSLEKDRNRRYETANGFALDVQRYLADEPVQACPPSTAYRFRKFARRNKRSLATMALLGVMMLAGVIGLAASNVMISREEKAKTVALELAKKSKEAADVQRQEAERQVKLVLETLDEFYLKEAGKRLASYQQIAQTQSVLNPEREKLEREFLERGAKFYERLALHKSLEPAARFHTARAYGQVAFIQVGLRNFKEAEHAYQKTLQLLRNLVEEFPDDPEYAFQYADHYHWSYRPFWDTLRLEPAEAVTRKALSLFESLTLRFPKEPRNWSGLAACQSNLGLILAKAGRFAEAEDPLIQAEALYTKLATQFPESAFHYYFALAKGLNLQAQLRVDASQGSIETWERPLTVWNKLLDIAPGDVAVRWNLAGCHEHIGELHFKAGRYQEADEAFTAALPIWEKLAAETNLPDHRFHLGCNREWAGQSFIKLGRLTEAAAAFQAAITIWDELVAEFNQPDNVGHLAFSRGSLQQVLDLQSKQAEIAKLEDAVAGFRKAIELDPKVAMAHYKLGLALYEQGKLDEAIPCYRTAIELDPKHVDTHFNLGIALKDQRKFDEAIPCFRKAVEIDPKHAGAHRALGNRLLDQGKLDEAISTFRTAIELDPKSANAHYGLARSLEQTRENAGAADAYHAAYVLDPERLRVPLNNFAWRLATHADPMRRDPSRAVELARQVDRDVPRNGTYLNTLGAAEYRAGNWKESMAALLKSMEVFNGEQEAFNTYFLAMAHWQLGEKDQARNWFDRAAMWMEKHQPGNEELGRLRIEAEELLEIKATR